MKQKKIVLGLLGSWLICASAAFAEFSLESPILSNYALSIQETRFSFATSGYLTEGPVRASGQPIDFSSLIKEAYLKGGFFASITGCFPGIDHCGFDVRRFSSQQISIDTILDLSSAVEVNSADIVAVAQSTIGDLGFEIIDTPGGQSVKISVVHGAMSFLRSQAEARTDNLAVKYLDHWHEKINSRSIVHRLITKYGETPFCYVSSRTWLSDENIEIYVGDGGISECLPQSFYTAVSLYPTLFETPSLGNLSMKYTAPTFADRLYVDILYNADFPIDRNLEEMKKFWSENVVNFWRAQMDGELDDR